MHAGSAAMAIYFDLLTFLLKRAIYTISNVNLESLTIKLAVVDAFLYGQYLSCAFRARRRALLDLAQSEISLYLSHPQPGPGEDQVDDHHQTRAVAGVWAGGDGQDHAGSRAGPAARGESRRLLRFHHQPQLPDPQSAAESDQPGVRGAAELEEL